MKNELQDSLKWYFEGDANIYKCHKLYLILANYSLEKYFFKHKNYVDKKKNYDSLS